MTSDRTHSLVYGRGEAQRTRREPALAPSFASVDERGLPELLAYVAELARLIGFVDERGRPAGDWAPFFEHDPSFLLAKVGATTADSLVGAAGGEPAEQNERGRNAALGEPPPGGESPALTRIFAMARRIDAWYCTAVRLETEGVQAHPFAQNLKQVIANDLSRYTCAIVDDKGLGAAWQRLADRADVRFAALWSSDVGRSLNFDPDDLAPVESAFRRSLAKLTELARRYLESTQQEGGGHAPHAGLLIAFVNLLRIVQGELNEFTGRHLFHYLHEVLRLAPRPSQPDRSLVAFTLAPGAAPMRLKAGSALAAGVDAAGAPIEFATATPLLVTQASVASLMAFALSYVDSGDADDARPLTSIVAYPVADSADGRGAPLPDPASGWPTFGLDREDAIAAGNLQPDAQVGFVIASPLLLLAGGERKITLSFEFGEAQEGSKQRLERLAAAYAGWLTQGAAVGAAPVTQDAVLDGLLAGACLVTLSGENGWFAPQAAHLELGASGTLDIVVELSAAAPAVLANPALAFGSAADDAPLPMLKVVMNPDARVYGYSFFEALDAARARVQVCVRGLRALELQNTLGPLVPGKPFMPFGPAPALGSFLQIGAPELACKPISHIGVELDWVNLPSGGLAAYFRGYPPGVDGRPLARTSFMVAIERNDGVAWQPASGDRTARYGLFAAASGAAHDVAAADTRFELDLAMPDAPDAPDAPTAGGAARRQAPEAGALRITLAAPAGAFGYDVYSRALAEAVMHNARAGQGGSPADLAPIPNPPFVPMASALSLKYTAEASVALEALERESPMRFYALTPFGYVRVGHGFETRFAPEGVRGALCIGLAQASPGDTLSLLFQLSDRHAPQSIDFTREATDDSGEPAASAGVLWHYLADNRWQRLRKQDVLSDTTYGLTCSGIVELVLPAQLDTASTLMPAGQFWLAAMAFDDAGTVSDTISILPNAVAVRRVTSGQTVVANLPPQSITGLVTKLPAIKSVVQPLASWGGLPAETEDAFAARVAERLRHKNQAIQPYDYERLVLGAFAAIAQAKCIGPGNSRGYSGTRPLAAGEVVVAVAAGIDGALDANVPQQTLREVRNFLRPHVSPFLRRLTVRNPVFERMKVVAAVQLKPAMSGAFYLNLLSAELDKMLTPWRALPEGRLPIGYGAIDGNSIASFIRQQEYVASLESFHLEVLTNVSPDGTGNDWRSSWFGPDDTVRPSTPWSVLVSAEHHLLRLVDGAIGDDAPQDPVPPGIGSLTVGDDLVAAPTPAPSSAPAAVPAMQAVFYVKFLERALRQDDARRRGERNGRERRAELLEDAFIEFPDHAERGLDDGPADSTDA